MLRPNLAKGAPSFSRYSARERHEEPPSTWYLGETLEELGRNSVISFQPQVGADWLDMLEQNKHEKHERPF